MNEQWLKAVEHETGWRKDHIFRTIADAVHAAQADETRRLINRQKFAAADGTRVILKAV